MEKLSYGGIDVSKDRLDVVVLPEGWFFSVSNDTAGWAELVATLRPLAVCAIGLEPSGGYERGIIRALLAARLSVRRINANKLRQFARARGVLAKNDRLDARLIAEYVAIMPTRAVQRDDAVERLAEVVTMRRQPGGPYGALGSGVLPLTTTMRSLANAAWVHVSTSSNRSRFSFSVLDWATQSKASSAYCRN